MVIFVTNQSAYADMRALILTGQSPAWLSAGVLTQQQIDVLWAKGINLSVLDCAVNTANIHDMNRALSTIKEHHWGHSIWAQIHS